MMRVRNDIARPRRNVRRQGTGGSTSSGTSSGGRSKWVPKTAVAANAPAHKEHIEARIARLKEEADSLTGKENHSIRAAKGKAIQELRSDPMYIDACRVAKGMPPMHGNFALGAHESGDDTPLSPEQAAKLAAEAEEKLKEEFGPAPSEATHTNGVTDEEAMFREWSERISKLEAKMEQPAEEVPPVVSEDVDELEAVAQEIVSYRLKLKAASGYRNKDLKADNRLHELEDRLDTVAGALLPSTEEQEPDQGVEELRAWERRLTAKLARHYKEVVGLKPSACKEVEQLIQEIAELKAQLHGLTESEQDKDERVLMKMVRLLELTQFRHKDKKVERREKQEREVIQKEIEQLQGRLDAHKRRLLDEGLKGNEVKRDDNVGELEERLKALLSMSHGIGGA